MPVSSHFTSSSRAMQPHEIDTTDKGMDVVEKMIDKITGKMVLFELSDSSFQFEDMNLDSTDEESDSGSSLSNGSQHRRVTFSNELVTNVWLRPPTSFEEKRHLFYTPREIWDFRMEYRAALKGKRQMKQQESCQIPETWSPIRLGNFMRKAATSITSVAPPPPPPPPPPLSDKEDQLDAMLVVDTLYLF